MNSTRFCELENRGLITVGGEEARHFLNGLVTCDVEHLADGGLAFGALLTPQGKILFDFFIIATADGFILDTDKSIRNDLVRRLTFYKLRARVEIAPMDDATRVFAVWGDGLDPAEIGGSGIFARDPRLSAMGARAYLTAPPDGAQQADCDTWQRHRIGVGMPEGGRDFIFGDAFPHEALMDQFRGVDFHKGCYVGQEVVSRMQHRGTARKRIIRVSAETVLPEAGAEVLVAGKTCGILTSVCGDIGLAMIRLDRAAAHAGGGTARAGSVSVTLSIPDWCEFGWPVRDTNEAE